MKPSPVASSYSLVKQVKNYEHEFLFWKLGTVDSVIGAATGYMSVYHICCIEVRVSVCQPGLV